MLTKKQIIKRLEYLASELTFGSLLIPYLSEEYLDEQVKTHYIPVMDTVTSKEETLKLLFQSGIDLSQYLPEKTIDELYRCLRLYAKLIKLQK